MATYPGAVVPSGLNSGVDPLLAPAMNGFAVDYWFPHASGASSYQQGPKTSNLPVRGVAIPNWSGQVTPTFRKDWYDRIHVFGINQSTTPPRLDNPINIGNLLSIQTRHVEVWNAYLTPKTLLNVSASNASGLSLTTAGSSAIGPLGDLIYTLQVTLQGSPTISAQYTFQFDTESPSLRITGSRVILFTLQPNWSEGITESWEWLTNILTSYNNTEQRIALRAQPRRTWEFTVFAQGKDRQLLENLLWGWQNRTFAVPVWWDRAALTAPANAGDAIIYLDTAGKEFQAGNTVVLFASPTRFEAAQIQSVTSASLQLTNGLNSAWPAGIEAYPTQLARIGAEQRVNTLTGEFAAPHIMFRLLQASTVFSAVDSSTTYRGLPVLEDVHDWSGNTEVGFSHKMAEMDNQIGNYLTVLEGKNPTRTRQQRWFMNGKAKLIAFRNWLYARKGRALPFWIPSGVRDFILTQPINSTDLSIFVMASDYTLLAQLANGRKDLRIETWAGVVYYRRITGSQIVTDTVESIGIDAQLGVTLAVNQVKLISFLSLSRLDADRIEIQMKAPNFGASTVPVRTLNYDV